MLGRDLIIYILQNNLEDADVFNEDFFKHFPTIESVSVRCNVGPATVKAWVDAGYLSGFKINGQVYIFPDSLNSLTEKVKLSSQ